MAYVPKVYADDAAGATPLTAVKLNSTEQGIAAAAAVADAAETPAGAQTKATAAQAAAIGASQPVDSDLTAIAALTTTVYGRAFLALVDAAAARAAMALGTAATASVGTAVGNVPVIDATGKLPAALQNAANNAVVKPGVYIPDGSLSQWYAARNAHATVACEVVIVGDSTTVGVGPGDGQVFGWVSALRAQSRGEGFVDGGIGRISTYMTVDMGDGYAPVVSFTGASTDTGVSDWTTATAGFSRTFKGTGRAVRFHHTTTSATTAATYTYAIDGGTAVAVTVPANSKKGSLLVGGLGVGLHTVVVTNTAAVDLAVAVDIFDNTKGLTFHRVARSAVGTQFIGASGTQPTYESDMMQVELGLSPGSATTGQPWGQPQAGSDYRHPKLVVIALGINDQQQATTVAESLNVIGPLDRGIKLARSAGADVLIVIPHLDYSFNVSPLSGPFSAAIAQVAVANGCALYDFNLALGPMNSGVGLAAGGPHVTQAAYNAEGTGLWRQVLGLNPPTGLVPVQTPPTVTLATSPVSPFSQGTTVTATASPTVAFPSAITTYLFAWGDGTTTAQTTPVATKVYAAAGTFTPSVTVTDSNGLTATASAAALTVNAVFWSDNFDRADASTVGSPQIGGIYDVHNAGGSGWVVGIRLNDLAVITEGSGLQLVLAPTGAADCTITVVKAVLNPQVVVRYVDDANYLFASPGGLTKVVAGVETSVFTTGSSFVTGDVLAIVLSGSTVSIKKNGTVVGTSSTVTNFTTATKHGFRFPFTGATPARWAQSFVVA